MTLVIPSHRMTSRWLLPTLARTRQRLSILSRLRSNDRPSFLGRLGHDFVGLRDAHYFFDSRFTLRDTPPAILPQRFHTFRSEERRVGRETSSCHGAHI